MLGVVLVLRHRQLSLMDIGVWRVGNWRAWAFALFFAALAIGGNLRFLPRIARSHFIRFLSAGISLAGGVDDGDYSWIL